MSNRSILITGGMGGVGQAVAKRFANDGFVVHLLYHNSPKDEVDSFLQTLNNSNLHSAYKCDITNKTEVESIVSKIESFSSEGEGIDVCVHAAVSPIIRRRISLIDSEDFRQQFKVTVFGGHNVFQTVVEYMKKRRRGSLIGITTSALHSEAKPTTMAGYICAKHALRGMLREFDNDLSINGICVNEVTPGFIETQLQKDLPDAALALIRNNSENVTTPEKVAATIADIYDQDIQK